ncbi:MAG TPA: hypothetical protein VGM81_10820 [Burkholderiaceae bacterium]|jgi:hypothetical protein
MSSVADESLSPISTLEVEDSLDLSAQAERELRSRRLLQLARIVMVGLVLSGITTVLSHDGITSGFLLGAFVFIAGSAWLNSAGATELAALCILWSLTALVSATMWFNQGLYSPAVLVYPCILVIANMLTRLRHFLMLLAFMLVAMSFMAWAAVSGWHVFEVNPTGWSQLVHLCVILSACASMMTMLAGDLRKALKRSCAGSTPSAATSRPRVSSRWPSAQVRSSRSGNGC